MNSELDKKNLLTLFYNHNKPEVYWPNGPVRHDLQISSLETQ